VSVHMNAHAYAQTHTQHCRAVCLRCGWVFLERTQILSGIQFIRHFIDLIVVETKKIVGSNVIVILTRQHAASARARLWEANAERQKIIFSGEFAICSQYQNLEETEI